VAGGVIGSRDTSAGAGTSVPTGWAWTEFDETCLPVSDGGRKVPQKAYLKSGLYPVVDQGEDLVAGYSDDASMVFKGAMPVIAFGDHTRRFKLINWPFVVGADGVKLIGPTRAWDARCLWYFLRALKFEDRGYSRHFQFLRKAKLPLPPLPEQTRIADVLDELLSDLDAGVSALERAREKLALYRAAVLQAAAEGSLVHSTKPYPLRPIGQAIESISQGWSPRCERLPSQDQDSWAVIKTTAIQPLRFLEEHNKRLPGSLTPRTGLELEDGDLLITRAGPRSRVGVACVVRRARPRLILCDKAYRIRCRPNSLSPTFLEVVLNAPGIAHALDGLKTGISDSGVNLTVGRLGELLVPFPSQAEQAAVVEAVDDQLSVIQHLEDGLNARLLGAEFLRLSILHRAYLGQLVAQDQHDEPASELLKRTASEREVRDREAGHPDTGKGGAHGRQRTSGRSRR